MLTKCPISRPECYDIVGIPCEVSGELLEEKVLKTLVAMFLLTVLRCANVLVEQMIQQFFFKVF